jgi:glycosyltransferase involved in cell wall biosynthesis
LAGLTIAINTTCAVAGGAVTHLKNLLPHLAEHVGQDRIVVLGESSTRAKLQPPAGVEWVSLPDSKGGLVGRVVRENTLVPRLLGQLGADVLFHPGNFAVFRGSIPQVILIHNLAPFLEEVIEGESLAQRVRLGILRGLTRRSLSRVDRVVFISKWGRQLVLGAQTPDELRHGSSKVDPVRLARFGVEADGFVLTVSHIYRYKHLEKLIAVWTKPESAVRNWPLLVVGAPFDAGYSRRLEAMASQADGRVRFTGALDSETLATLMQAARAFVFTSEAENLPITLLEAMAAGCPIITNRYCSMPETCEDAALYVDPATVEGYQAELEKLLGDEALRSEMRGRALRRARDFRWDAVAAQTLETLRSAAVR